MIRETVGWPRRVCCVLLRPRGSQGYGVARGRARFETRDPPVAGQLERSPHWAGIDTCWASCSSGWSSANALSGRRKRLSRTSAGLLRNLRTAAQHETASMSTAHTHTAHRCRAERGRRTFAHLTPQASTAGCGALGSRAACPRQPCATTRALGPASILSRAGYGKVAL